MRLRKITLREIHLRLLSPFQTSFGTSDLRRILLVEADVDGVSALGRIHGRRKSVLLLRNSRDRVADPARLSLAVAEGQGNRRRVGSVGSARACSRPQHGQGRARNGLLGRRSEAEKPAARKTSRRHARRDSVRRLHRHSADDHRAHRQGGGSARRRLSANQDQNQAGSGRRAGARAPRAVSAASG